MRSRRSVTFAVLTVIAVLICSIHASVAGADTIHAAGIGYLCFSLAMFGCAVSFFARMRTAGGSLRIRWSLIAAGALAASVGYLPSFTQFIFATPPQRVLQTACFNASEALYMLAAVLFFAGVDRSIVLVDSMQALVFILLRFNLVYSPATFDNFTSDHLLIGQLVALFLFLVALVACLGAASRAEYIFLRTLSLFFALRLISMFLANQVSYTWLHHINCGLWDVSITVLLGAFSLYMFHSSPSAHSQMEDSAPRTASVMVRSLMPSFLALANLILGLFLLRSSTTLAAAAMSLSLVCYVMRTVLLQSQAMKEKTLLQSRNEQLEGLAVRDPLTGIGNRRSLAEAYGRLQDMSAPQPISLLLIDIDKFKQANDTLGHQHGDRVLVALARKLESLSAGVAGSHSVRMGGDEFAMLLPNVSPQTASALAEELRFLFAAHRFETVAGSNSLSIGIASLQAGRNLPLETLVLFADQALYRAKRLGRNRVEVQPMWEPGVAPGSEAAVLQLELQHS